MFIIQLMSMLLMLSFVSSSVTNVLPTDITSQNLLKEEFLLDFIKKNNLQEALFLTDKESVAKHILHLVSSLLVRSSTVVLKRNVNASSNLVASLESCHNIFIWCGPEFRNVISLMSRRGLFGKQFTLVFVLPLKNGVSELIAGLLVNTTLSPVSNVFCVTNEMYGERRFVRLIHTQHNSSHNIDAVPQLLVNIRTGKQLPKWLPLQGYKFKIGVVKVPTVLNFTIEIIELLSEYLGFRYSLVFEKAGFGGLHNGKWIGLIGGVIRREYDFGGFPTALTPERLSVVDFVSFVAMTNYVAVMKRPADNSEECSVSVYAVPFSLTVWMACTVMCILTFTCITATLKQCSRLWNVSEAGKQPSRISVSWSMISAIFQTGGNALPDHVSIQALFTTFVFFCIVLKSVYNSLLTAGLIAQRGSTVFNNLDELIDDGQYGISIVESISAIEFLKRAQSGTLQRTWNKILSHPRRFVSEMALGYQKAKEEKFAFFNVELSASPTVAASNCSMIILKQRYLPTSSNYFFPKNSSFVEPFSLKIQSIRSAGILQKIYSKYFPKMYPEDCKSKPLVVITVQRTIGAFAALIAGILLSSLCLLAELLCKKKNLM